MDEEAKVVVKYAGAAILILIVGIWGFSALYNVYAVWSAHKGGEAHYAQAEMTRRIKVLEAEAKMESAKFLAEAEILRAEGVAKANKIIGDSLKGNEAYLRYLWIDGLQHAAGQVIYVPTEANLPVLEATRLRQP